MLRIDKTSKKLVRLKQVALSDAEHWERDLQAMIFADPDTFCAEMGESLWVIDQEVRPSDAVADRIDILAIDEAGAAVIIELKRGSHKLQLLQAISYAGMVSRWSPDKFIEALSKGYSQSLDDARAALEEHTGEDASSLNLTQRIVLIAENFDPALLISAEWLHEKFKVDIRCYRITLAQEDGSDYLTCSCIYPPIEIAALSRGNEAKGQTSEGWASWDAALEDIENVTVKEFVRAELAKHQEARLSTREVIYRVRGKRRFWLGCRKKHAYVWQLGRFDGDEVYWRERVSEPNHVQQVRDNRALRFHLTTSADFEAFSKALLEDISKLEFSESVDLDSSSDHE